MTQDERLREEFRLKFTHSYMEDPTNVLILGEIENYWLKVLHHEREQLIEEVEALKKDVIKTAQTNEEVLLDVDYGFNQAKQDTIDYLKSEIEKI